MNKTLKLKAHAKAFGKIAEYKLLQNNQINARALIGQSAVGFCAGKPTVKSRVL